MPDSPFSLLHARPDRHLVFAQILVAFVRYIFQKLFILDYLCSSKYLLNGSSKQTAERSDFEERALLLKLQLSFSDFLLIMLQQLMLLHFLEMLS